MVQSRRDSAVIWCELRMDEVFMNEGLMELHTGCCVPPIPLSGRPE